MTGISRIEDGFIAAGDRLAYAYGLAINPLLRRADIVARWPVEVACRWALERAPESIERRAYGRYIVDSGTLTERQAGRVEMLVSCGLIFGWILAFTLLAEGVGWVLSMDIGTVTNIGAAVVLGGAAFVLLATITFIVDLPVQIGETADSHALIPEGTTDA